MLTLSVPRLGDCDFEHNLLNREFKASLSYKQDPVSWQLEMGPGWNVCAAQKSWVTGERMLTLQQLPLQDWIAFLNGFSQHCPIEKQLDSIYHGEAGCSGRDRDSRFTAWGSHPSVLFPVGSGLSSQMFDLLYFFRKWQKKPLTVLQGTVVLIKKKHLCMNICCRDTVGSLWTCTYPQAGTRPGLIKAHMSNVSGNYWEEYGVSTSWLKWHRLEAIKQPSV